MFLILVLMASVINALTFLYFWKSLKATEKTFGVLVVVMALFEIFATSSILFFHVENNLYGLHLYTLIAFVLLNIFYAKVFRQLDWNFPLTATSIVGMIAIISYSVFFQSISSFNNLSKSVSDFYFAFLSVLFFVRLINIEKEKKQMQGIKYFVSAIFFNAAVTSVLYLFSNVIVSMAESYQVALWSIVVVINLITQLIILFGIVTIVKSKKSGNLVLG